VKKVCLFGWTGEDTIMVSNIRVDSVNSAQVGRAYAPANNPKSVIDSAAMTLAESKINLKEAVAMAINPVPVLHAPVKVNTEEMAQNLKNAIEHINQVLKDGGRGLSFVVDEVMNQPIVRVTREDTGETIRQYPSEAIVRVAHNIEKLKGVLFKELI